MREDTLYQYFSRVKQESLPSTRWAKRLTLRILHPKDKGYSIRYAGWADYKNAQVLIQDWLLSDRKQAESTVRHELAHFYKTCLWLPGKEHGANFRACLRAISGRSWKRDCHWQLSEPIKAFMAASGRKRTPKRKVSESKGE